MFLDRQVWANSVDPDQTGLPIRLHLLDTLLYDKSPCSNFRVITADFSGVQIFRIFMVLEANRHE